MNRQSDEYLEDPKGRSEDEFLASSFSTLAPHFQPVEQAIAGMEADVRTRMAEAGRIDEETSEPALAPVPTLEDTPEWPPPFPPRNLHVVDRSETSLSVVWNSITRATHYEVQRGDSEDGEYTTVATEVATLGLVGEGLHPNSVYYYVVKACNHLGCTEFSGGPVAGVTESDADVSIPASPKDVQIVRKKVEVFPDRDEVTWTAVEGATYYEVYRAGDRLTTVSAPLNISSHTDLGAPLTSHPAHTTRSLRATRPAVLL